MKRKSLKAFLAFATAATMAIAPMSAMASESQAGQTSTTIASVETGSGYVATSASDDDTINSPSYSSNITKVTMSDGTVYKASDLTTETEEGTTSAQGVLTLVVNGQQEDIVDYLNSGKTLEAGSYSFETTAGTDFYAEMAKFGTMGGNTAEYTFRSALKVVDGAVVENETIPALLANATYDAASLTNGTLVSNGAFFNGVIVKGSDFAIDKMNMEFIGDGANDFNGEAAAVLVGTYKTSTADDLTSSGGGMPGGPGGMPGGPGEMPEGGGAPSEEALDAEAEETASASQETLTISDTYIHTAGVIRTAAAAIGNGILKINDSVIYTEEGNDTDAQYDALVVPMMKRTPFALGIEGTVRATNVLGSGQGIYRDSLIASSGWGVLSTDSGTAYSRVGTYALDVKDVVAGIGSVKELTSSDSEADFDAVKEVNGKKYGFKKSGSGYVAYADSGVYDKFENVTFLSDDYVQIMASNQSSAFYTDSTIESGRIAVMTQQNGGGRISIKDSTVKAEDTAVQIKSGAANDGYTYVVFDNADVQLGTSHNYGGTLVELVESDDAGNPGNTTFTIDDQGANATYTDTTVSESTVEFTNGTYVGNVWNNIYNKRQMLDVLITNATLEGTISSSIGSHMDQNNNVVENGTVLNAYTHADYRTGGLDDYLVIGAQYNTAAPEVNNKVNVDLTNGGVWNIVLADGTCGEAGAIYLGDVLAEEGTQINSETPVTIYYSGTYDVADGVVGDNVTFEPYSVDTTTEATGVVQTTQFYSGTPIEFVAQDAEGNLLGTDVVSVDGQAFTNYQFSLSIAEGYSLVSMTPNFGEITEGSDQGYAYTYTESAAANGEKHVVTIVVSAAGASDLAKNKITVKKKLTVKKGKSAKIKASANGAKLTFKKLSGNKKITVKKNGKVKVAKKLASKTYKIKVKITAKANSEYAKATKKATIKVKVK